MVDVATPIMTERYTAAGCASAAPPGMAQFTAMISARPETLPGLDGLWLVGQSVGGPGLPGCAAVGRNAVKALGC
jgi:phytoene dehydrogenase-like protein